MAQKEPRVPSEHEKNIMDALMSKLTDRQLSRMAAPNVSKMFTRKMIQDAFLETFELVGGINRLAIWANESGNYETFLRLLMVLAPKETMEKEGGGKVLNYQSAVPRSSLVEQTKRVAPSTKIDEDVSDA